MPSRIVVTTRLASSADEIATRGLYERWAARYPPLPHNPLMRAEQHAMLQAWPAIAGRRALDLACGSGRYAQLLADGGAAQVVALDFCTEMLRQVGVGSAVAGNMMSLPFRRAAFDVVVSGLAVGHAERLDTWMLEVARVLVSGGVLLYSDFHPAAVEAGHSRRFKDAVGRTHSIPHHCHGVATHAHVAQMAGLRIEAIREVRAAVELCEPFPGSVEFYQRWKGMPFALVIRASKC